MHQALLPVAVLLFRVRVPMSQNQAEDLMAEHAVSDTTSVAATVSPGKPNGKVESTRSKARRVQRRNAEVASLARRLLQLLKGSTPAEASALAKAIRKKRGGEAMDAATFPDEALARAAEELRRTPQFVKSALVPKLALNNRAGGASHSASPPISAAAPMQPHREDSRWFAQVRVP